MNPHPFVKRPLVACVFVLVALSSAAVPAFASILGRTDGFPDIPTTGIKIDYDAVTDVFSAVGVSMKIDMDSSPVDPAIGRPTTSTKNWTLNAKIDENQHVVANSGGLTITGSVTSLGITSTAATLLSGTLIDFGIVSSGPTSGEFEFIFKKDAGGALNSYYGDFFGVKLHAPLGLMSSANTPGWSFQDA